MPAASHTFLLSFSSDKAYPDYWEMQDITSYLNGYTKLVGNPDLRPSTDYTANFTYILKNKYMFDLYYTHVKDLFAQLAYQSPDELSMIYQSVNYDYEQNFGASVIIPFAVGGFWNSVSRLTALVLGMFATTITASVSRGRHGGVSHDEQYFQARIRSGCQSGIERHVCDLFHSGHL